MKAKEKKKTKTFCVAGSTSNIHLNPNGNYIVYIYET